MSSLDPKFDRLAIEQALDEDRLAIYDGGAWWPASRNGRTRLMKYGNWWTPIRLRGLFGRYLRLSPEWLKEFEPFWKIEPRVGPLPSGPTKIKVSQYRVERRETAAKALRVSLATFRGLRQELEHWKSVVGEDWPVYPHIVRAIAELESLPKLVLPEALGSMSIKWSESINPKQTRRQRRNEALSPLWRIARLKLDSIPPDQRRVCEQAQTLVREFITRAKAIRFPSYNTGIQPCPSNN